MQNENEDHLYRSLEQLTGLLPSVKDAMGQLQHLAKEQTPVEKTALVVAGETFILSRHANGFLSLEPIGGAKGENLFGHLKRIFGATDETKYD